MTYNAIEVSNQDGQPVKLYEFRLGTLVYRYTDADRDISFDGETWTAVPISDSGVIQGVNESFKVTVSPQAAVCDHYILTPPMQEMALKVRRFHFGDTEAALTWVGSVSDARRPDYSRVELTCRTLNPTFQRGGLRLAWGKTCPHFIYGAGCGVDPELFKVETTIGALDGVGITPTSVAPYALSDFAGGFVSWDIGGGTLDRRMIRSPSGSALLLLGTTDGLSDGQSITLHPGCKRTVEWCEDFFDNLDNNGGFPHIPEKSPFDGDPVF